MGDKPLLSRSGKWIVGSVAVVALLIAGVGVARLLASRQAATVEETAPQPEPAAKSIAALGRIEPQGEVIDVSGPSGERLETLLVEEGDVVSAGQPIAILESHDERKAERDLAASRLQDLLAEASTTRSAGRQGIAEARTRLSQASAPKLKEIEAQEATISEISAELELAQSDLNRFSRLQAEGAISQKDLDDRQLAFRTKQQQLRQAQRTLEQLQQEREANIENARAQVQTAQANLQLDQAQLGTSEARSNLQLAEVRLARTIIRAPQSGQILEVLLRPGESIEINTGAGGSSQGIVRLGDTSQMYAVAEVYETDVSRVRVGQAATVTSSAFPEEISGVVQKVGLQIGKNDVIDSDPAANTDTRVVEVKVRLNNSQPVAMLTNLQVNVVIHLER